ncbi:hypothetical protein [Faecalicatena contorta]|uniref:Uncharacterized protein n=1 Tax=Faecalicatena contorta TaxID=39482 RepID=A0A315ZWL9_9FIRM|nr:hypothetical protein [Faecalicatena contorta]PWJ48994.1 hypothetical protein A8805_109136 [Faecalicatena contorta]SUQ15084.1 hypothetical protein SAMN05216529_109136 [Faecalicatena contorta]
MSLNLNQIAMLQKFKSSMDRFHNNHPKFQLFVKAVSNDALAEGTIIEINVTTPEGKSYSSNIKLKEDDIETIKMLQQLDQ